MNAVFFEIFLMFKEDDWIFVIGLKSPIQERNAQSDPRSTLILIKPSNS